MLNVIGNQNTSYILYTLRLGITYQIALSIGTIRYAPNGKENSNELISPIFNYPLSHYRLLFAVYLFFYHEALRDCQELGNRYRISTITNYRIIDYPLFYIAIYYLTLFHFCGMDAGKIDKLKEGEKDGVSNV